MMELKKIQEILVHVAVDHSPSKSTDEAVRAIALALLHMAEGIEELRIAVARLSDARPG